MHKFDAIVFDFDYTLADSSQGIIVCVNHALSEMGLRMAEPEAICLCIGLALPETLRILAGPQEPERVREFVRLFISRADEIMADLTHMYPETFELARSLHRWGYRIGIVSTKFRYRMDAILSREGLLHYFDVLIGGEDVKKPKPDPEGLLIAAKQLNVLSSRMLYVGDSVIDAETAQRANIKFVAVLTGVTPRAAFASQSCEAIFDDLSGLIAWLRE